MTLLAIDYKATDTTSTQTITPGTFTILEVHYVEDCINAATGKPMVKPTKYGSRVFLELITQEGVTLPMGMDYAELPYLVEAFTGDASNLLPPVPTTDNIQALERYLIKVVQLCNTSTKKPIINIKPGYKKCYFNTIVGALLPEEDYIFLMEDIPSKDRSTGKPTPTPNKKWPDKKTFNLKLRIVLNSDLKKDGWCGALFKAWRLPYGFEIVEVEGSPVTGACRVKSGDKKGKYTPTAEANNKLFKALSPTMFADEAHIKIDEPGNLLPELLQYGLQDKQPIKARVTTNNGYNNFQMDSVIPKNIDVSDVTTPNKPSSKGIPNNVYLGVLRDIINVLEGPIFEVNPGEKTFPKKYTPMQSAAMKKYISGLLSQLSTQKPNDYSFDDVNLIVANMYQGDVCTNTQVTNLMKKLAVNLEPEASKVSPLEEDEIPF